MRVYEKRWLVFFFFLSLFSAPLPLCAAEFDFFMEVLNDYTEYSNQSRSTGTKIAKSSDQTARGLGFLYGLGTCDELKKRALRVAKYVPENFPSKLRNLLKSSFLLAAEAHEDSCSALEHLLLASLDDKVKEKEMKAYDLGVKSYNRKMDVFEKNMSEAAALLEKMNLKLRLK